MQALVNLKNKAVAILDPVGTWVALLPIRLLMGYEFASAGMKKFGASDTLYGDVPGWFASKGFPFPFSLFSAEFNWFIVTWVEIIGGIALFFGLFTRFWAFSLSIVTIVAILSTHWPAEWNSLAELWDGYRITASDGSGNYRVPLMFLVMLVPLVFTNAGKLSLDNILARKFG